MNTNNTKTVIVTGASRGIGRACALRFEEDKANLVICCKNSTDALLKTADEIKAMGCNVLTFTGDLGSQEFVADMIKATVEHFHRIDVLVNNAGISLIETFDHTSFEQWSAVISANLTSVYNCCHETIPYMIHEKSGSIINIASMWGETGASCEVAYSASKGGVIALTKALSKELAPSGIAVNCVSPGVIDTEMNSHLSDEEKAELCESIPASRYGTSGEVAELVHSVSEQSSYFTGQCLRIDGGLI